MIRTLKNANEAMYSIRNEKQKLWREMEGKQSQERKLEVIS